MSDYADNLRKSIINAKDRFVRMVEDVREKQKAADREEIIRMARAAGLGWDDKYHWFVSSESLERFANLIAAAEREACAKLCEDDGMLWGARYAAKIRAKGEK